MLSAAWHNRPALATMRVEDRLEIGRRAGDDAEDLARRRLLLQRLLGLVEQPHVLDRDDRLVGEGLRAGQSRPLRMAPAPAYGDGDETNDVGDPGTIGMLRSRATPAACTNHLAHRIGEVGSVSTSSTTTGRRSRSVRWSSGSAPTETGNRRATDSSPAAPRRGEGSEMERSSRTSSTNGRVSTEQLQAAPNDRVEHRLDVGR